MVHVEMQNTGDAKLRAEVAAVIEHFLADRTMEWYDAALAPSVVSSLEPRR
jgi:hypothetical protein